ncbi:MAG: hypothetical protein SF123_17365 [Chloroflexota bacterium]|nr:hypothetical protein [Chloroflexota bacterium]
MPIQVKWDRAESDTLDIVFSMPWVWQELYDIRDLVRFMIEGVNGTVHVLYDMRSCRVPAGNAIPHLRNFVNNLPPQAREGLHVFVGSNPDWKAHMTLFTRTYPDLALDIVYVSNREDGVSAVHIKKEQLALLDEDDDETSRAIALDEPEQSMSDTQPVLPITETAEVENWQPVYTKR